MMIKRPFIGVLLTILCILHPGRVAVAQGVTTGGITGIVTDETGHPVESAQVQLRNPQTGFNVASLTRASGQYTIQGIEPNSNYSVTVRRIGYSPLTRTNITITLSQTRREDFTLNREATTLSAVTVTASADAVMNPSRTGTGTSISDSALHRLPTLNRNFADFVQLVPQVSTTTGFLSGGGVNLRQNSIQIDGAQSGDLFGLGTTGQPGAQANAKSIPLDAVKEYQVLLSPFDVRQGGFGGLLINAVTKSGTNEWHGSAFEYTRNQNLTRKQPYLNDFKQNQFGGSVGGPILKDKLFFFGSAELQRQQTPALGPYLGSPDVPVSQSSIDQLNGILTSKYGFSGTNSGEQVLKKNPNSNYFARIDAYLPWSTRLVLRHNYAGADNTVFSRGNPTTTTPSFNLTSNSYEFSSKTNSSVAEFLTNLTNGTYNELLLNYTTTKDFRTVPVNYPQLTVRGVPRSDGQSGTVNFVVGTEASSQGNSLDQRTIELTDNITIPIGTHSVTFGTKNLFYRSINLFASNSLGSWTFANMDSLNRGVASSYTISAPAATDPFGGLSTIKAATYALYAQDAWQATPRLMVTAGVRWDKPHFGTTPPENAAVFTDYGRHTSFVPSNSQISPRIGMNWDVTGDQRNQLRGGVGFFTGPPPFVYLSNAYGNTGLSGFASITCDGTTTSTTSRVAPAFNAQSIASPPTSCVASGGKPGATTGLSSNIASLDPNFKFPKYLKATAGFDHAFRNGLVGTLEGLYTRSSNNVFYQNLALAGPQGTDAHGRVMYGNLTATGSSPVYKAGGRTQVLDVTNSSGDYSWSVTGQLQKTFSDRFEGSAAYTYQQARDVASTTSSTQGSNFRYQRSVSGDLLDKSVTRSKYDQPHRIVATGTYRFPTRTDVSFIYTGNSGAPIDFVYGAPIGSTLDANADGQTQNDLVYVPRDAHDPNEILFTGFNGTPAQQASAAAQADAYEKFINANDCLARARGSILTRNACRNPWVNEIDLTVAQSLARFRMQDLQVRLDVINLGNLLNKNWGQQAFSDQNATCGQICSSTTALVQSGNLLPTGQTSSQQARGIYTFDPTYQAFTSNNASSNYRMQLSLRYSF